MEDIIDGTPVRLVEDKGRSFWVSACGRIWAPEHQTHCMRGAGIRRANEYVASRPRRELSTRSKTKSGYVEIGVMQHGKRSKHALHRLVAIAWCEGWHQGACVNHINGIKTDNRAENLEWLTLAENTKHAFRSGLVATHGENSGTSKLTDRQVIYIRRLLGQGVSANALAVIAGVSQGAIALIRDGKRWRHLLDGGQGVKGSSPARKSD